MSKSEEMKAKVGNTRHQDCSYCKKEKREHIFIQIDNWLSTEWGWKCQSCGHFHRIYKA